MNILNSLNIEQKIKQINELKQDIDILEKNKKSIIDEISSLNRYKTEIEVSLRNRENLYVETELKYIDTLGGLEFEQYAANLLEKNCYTAIVTKSSQDDGGDIVATKDKVKYVIQCKNYSSPVGNKAVQEVYAAKGIYKCDKAIVLTNNFFTKQAKKEAKILDIELLDRYSLSKLICSAYKFILCNLDYSSNIKTDKDEDVDDLLDEAIEMCIETGQASTSYIQRRFKIGYAQAGRIIDQMEERGIISGYQGSKPREVLMSKERWQELKSSSLNQF